MLPGAGQVYQPGKSWKEKKTCQISFTAGLITDIYLSDSITSRSSKYSKKLWRCDNGDPTNFPTLNRDALSFRIIDLLGGNRDSNYILLAAIYGAQILLIA